MSYAKRRSRPGRYPPSLVARSIIARMGQQRRYPHPPKPPITLGELRAGNVPLSASCPICLRSATFYPHAIDGLDTATVEDVTRRLRCTGCGRMGGMGVCPDGEAWVWYLRRTGQRDRLPWYRCFVRDEGS